jgi:transcriptional regulator with XRE-family HTH domain
MPQAQQLAQLGFGPLLKRLIDESPYDQAGFAEAVGLSRSYITDIIKERRPPPLDDVADWASKLGVTGKIAQILVDRAMVARFSPAQRLHFLRLLARLERLDDLQARLLELEETAKAKDARIAELEAELTRERAQRRTRPA